MRWLRTFSYPSEVRQFDFLLPSSDPAVSAALSLRARRRVSELRALRLEPVTASVRHFGSSFQPVFRRFGQIRADRIRWRDGFHSNLKQNERHARDWPRLSWTGTNAA
jgi:hypothetical protein